MTYQSIQEALGVPKIKELRSRSSKKKNVEKYLGLPYFVERSNNMGKKKKKKKVNYFLYYNSISFPLSMCLFNNNNNNKSTRVQ